MIDAFRLGGFGMYPTAIAGSPATLTFSNPAWISARSAAAAAVSAAEVVARAALPARAQRGPGAHASASSTKQQSLIGMRGSRSEGTGRNRAKILAQRVTAPV